jgi:chromosomal replication initiation ATPase DnaA
MINLVKREGFYIRASVDRPLTLEEHLDKLVSQMVEFGAVRNVLMGRTREQEPKTWRQIAMWYARKSQWGTLKAIGKYFNRDHSSIISSVNYINDLIESNDKDVVDKLNKLGIKHE